LPGGTTWGRWLVGKALPLAICALLAIAVGQGLHEDASKLGREGLALYSTLDLARRALTLIFVLLIATSYLTRGRVVSPASGFGERIFPLVVLLAGPIGVVFLGRHSVPERLDLAGSGLLAALSGAGLSLWSLWHLRASFSILAEARSPVTSGPYRYVRHPLYLGEALMMLGLCLMIGTLPAFLFWASLNALQVIRARIEERKLANQFEEYRLYQQRTRFIIPGVY
jgi:protein-S-isoprenylcysteine O-methyltransferase Ste14